MRAAIVILLLATLGLGGGLFYRHTEAIKQEKQTRAQETASIETRLKNLEYLGPTATTTRKY